MVIKNENYIYNNPLIESNVAIIVTSHQGHLMFLKKTLEQYMASKNYVICSYDRHGETIPDDIMEMCHAWVFKHETFGAEKRNGWLWDIVYGSGIINTFSNFDYIFTVNSDCIWEKPDRVDYIIYMMGDADVFSASSNGTIHTCNVVWKRQCFLDFVSHIKFKLSNNIPVSYSPEALLRDFVIQCGYKNLTAPLQPIYPEGHFYEGKVDHYSAYNQDSTWKRILGYRNLGGEHKASCQEHLEPVDSKYFDLRNGGEFLNQHERKTLFFYLVSGDRIFLYKYWAEGEDSYWNRRYNPIDYYGFEKLTDDSKRKELGPPSERLGHFDRLKYNSYVLKDEEYENKWKGIATGG